MIANIQKIVTKTYSNDFMFCSTLNLTNVERTAAYRFDNIFTQVSLLYACSCRHSKVKGCANRMGCCNQVPLSTFNRNLNLQRYLKQALTNHFILWKLQHGEVTVVQSIFTKLLTSLPVAKQVNILLIASPDLF